MKRSLLDYTIIYLKGIAMGAADVVPGVSGGTIAFISGIYEELIDTINRFNLEALQTLRKEGLAAAWKQINGNFLVALLLGIGTSVLSLAKLIKYLLDHEPVLLWSFFFGLVLASIWLVAREIPRWTPAAVAMFILGALSAYLITTITPSTAEHGALYMFLSGALAICAMILPGISGAFILVLLGAYEPVLQAVNNRELGLLALVGAGAVFGLLSFSRLLKYLFAHYHTLTLAVLTGFIFGSLNKIWPWKEVTATQTVGEKIITLSERSVLPSHFNGDPKLLTAILLALAGFMSIFILEKVALRKAVK